MRVIFAGLPNDNMEIPSRITKVETLINNDNDCPVSLVLEGDESDLRQLACIWSTIYSHHPITADEIDACFSEVYPEVWFD